MMLSALRPASATRIMPEIRIGKDCTTSEMRITNSLIRPPKKPQSRPMMVPAVTAKALADTAISRSVRGAVSTRENTSSPASSVPNQCTGCAKRPVRVCQTRPGSSANAGGGTDTAGLAVSGGNGASSGLSSASSSTSATMTAPVSSTKRSPGAVCARIEASAISVRHPRIDRRLQHVQRQIDQQ